MIVGIGVDLLHLPRLRSLLVRRNPQQLASRILSKEEIKEWVDRESVWDTKQMESYLALRCFHTPCIPLFRKFADIASLPSSLPSRSLTSTSRWTAKEAAYKALYPHVKPTWKDLVVRKLEKKPILEFSPSFLSNSSLQHSFDGSLDQLKIHLSVSHDGDMMVAYVVVEQG